MDLRTEIMAEDAGLLERQRPLEADRSAQADDHRPANASRGGARELGSGPRFLTRRGAVVGLLFAPRLTVQAAQALPQARRIGTGSPATISMRRQRTQCPGLTSRSAGSAWRTQARLQGSGRRSGNLRAGRSGLAGRRQGGCAGRARACADQSSAPPTTVPRYRGAAGGRTGLALGQLDDRAEVHHRDAVADVADHAEVVGDEQVGQAELALQVREQVEDLRLDRHVERRHRLVADHQLRAARPARARCRCAGAGRPRTRAG